MRKIVVAVLVLAIAALANSAFAIATWEHFNADPAYHSREAAIADAPRVLRQAGYPEPAISLLTEAMKNPGVETHVTNGMRFDFMRSGKSALWRNVVVKFSKPPSEKSMEYSAPSEEWTVDWNGAKWTVGIPKVCNNIYGRRPLTPAAPPVVPQPLAPTPVAHGPILGCPDVWTLKINVWEHKAMTLPGVASTHAKEELGVKESRKRFVGIPHVSRTHGKQLREAYANGELNRSTTERRHRVFLIMTPQATGGDATIASEQFVADVTITGMSELRFTRAQLNQWDAIRVVAIDGDVESPPSSGLTGLHELRLFSHLPGTKLGEWDNNLSECLINIHEIEPPGVRELFIRIGQ